MDQSIRFYFIYVFLNDSWEKQSVEVWVLDREKTRAVYFIVPYRGMLGVNSKAPSS